MGYSRWGQKELDVTELLTLALACVWNECGETNCGIFTEWNAAAAAAKSLQSCPTLCNPLDGSPPGPLSWNSPGKNTGVGCHSLLQGIFPTQVSNPGLLHCRQILYHLSHQGSPIMLDFIMLGTILVSWYYYLKLKLQYFGHLMQRADSLEKTLKLGKIEGRRRSGWQKMRWLYIITDSMNMNLNKFWKIV